VVTFYVLLCDVADTHNHGAAERVDGEVIFVKHVHGRPSHYGANFSARRHYCMRAGSYNISLEVNI